MDHEELKRAFKSQPFEPQRIHSSNGSTFDVPHPDCILISPRTFAILVGEAILIVANVHINYVEPLALAK